MKMEELRPARARLEIDGKDYFFRPLDLAAQVNFSDLLGGPDKFVELFQNTGIRTQVFVTWRLLENRKDFANEDAYFIKVTSSNGRLDIGKVTRLGMAYNIILGSAQLLKEQLEKNEETKKAIPTLIQMLA